MADGFRLFGPLHLTILASIPAAAYACARWARPWARWVLGSGLILNEVVWYFYRYTAEGFRFPEGLPLQLCDVALWLCAFAALTLSPLVYELGWYWGVAGAGMALLTPDLWAPCWTYPTLYFFFAHGAMVVVMLYLGIAGLARPRRGSILRALAGANIYAILVGIFNWVFGTNYMYLCRKPVHASVLDWFGPWPYYLVAGEVLALALFALLWLPFARRRTE